MNNRHLIALAILPMGIALAFESGECQFAPVVESVVEPYSATLTGNPHTHFEVADGSPTTSVPLFVSGGQGWQERYALHIRPHADGFQLFGYPHSGDPNGKPQMMFGFSANVDSLIGLVSRFGLPPAQIEAVRRVAIEGREQQNWGPRIPSATATCRLVQDRNELSSAGWLGGRII